MRGRSGSFAIPSSATESVFTERLKRLSLDESSLETKETLSLKLEKYRILLEKEYELRSRLAESQKLAEENVPCCDCGKKFNALLVPQQSKIERSQSDIMKNIQENKDGKSRTPLRRQLSVDDIKTSNATMLRKIAAKEKAEKRRASMQSLEDDFVKARSLIQRSRSLDTSSEDSSINYGKGGNLVTVEEYDQMHAEESQNKNVTSPKRVPIFYI